MSCTTKLIATGAVSLLLATASIATASGQQIYVERPDDETSGASIAADVIVVRPLSFVATVLGTTVFFLGLPFAAMAGDLETPGRVLVQEPAAYTFKRPLGDLDF
ncbi:MAG: hypothetical protein ABR587_13655 [Candidatus Binatia bacterium]